MKFPLVLVLMLLGPLMALAAEQVPRPPQAPPVQEAVVLAPAPVICECGPNCRCAAGECQDGNCPSRIAPKVIPEGKEAYDSAYRQAASKGHKLALFVGCEPRDVPGACSVRWDDYPGATAGIYVGTPGSSHFEPYAGGGSYRVTSAPASYPSYPSYGGGRLSFGGGCASGG